MRSGFKWRWRNAQYCKSGRGVFDRAAFVADHRTETSSRLRRQAGNSATQRELAAYHQVVSRQRTLENGADAESSIGVAGRRICAGFETPAVAARLAQRRRVGSGSRQRAGNVLGPRAIVQNMVQRRSGSIVENANRISLLRDSDGDGIAEAHSVLLEGLRQPFGMALVGDQLFVANTDSVVRFPYRTGDTRITDKGTKVLDLPVGHHWTRTLLASRDGTKLFVTVGSGSNIGEKGMDIEEGRATILEFDIASGRSRIFASGLRNANGMAIEPSTGVLWTVVNERDEIGDDVPPDYLTSVKDGGFYGWPYSYWGKNVDTRVQPQRPDLVAAALTPDYALGAHTASLGLAYYGGTELPAPLRGGVFIGQHGSWNRSDYSGYKVIFVPFKDGRPSGNPVDVLTGFLKDDGSGVAHGRPVGVAIDARGALLVADDTGNTVWRVTAGQRQSQAK